MHFLKIIGLNFYQISELIMFKKLFWEVEEFNNLFMIFIVYLEWKAMESIV
jgi:hypothetical protein